MSHHYADNYISKLMEPQLYCEFCKRTHGKLHADISFNLIKNESGEFVVIHDLNEGNRSITNDVEWVLWAVNDYYIKNFDADFNIDEFKILYRDSEGIWDGIKFNGIEFKNFYPIRALDVNDAMEMAK